MENMDNIVNYKGVDYEIVFNLNVMQEIQEEFGTVEEWGNLTESGAEPNMKALIFGLTSAINEGIEIYNEDHEDKKELLTHKQVGRLVTAVGMEEVTKKLKSTVVESTESEEKNA